MTAAVSAFLDWLTDLLIEVGGRIAVAFMRLPSDTTTWSEM